ncbi:MULTISPECIES: HD domain-containing protein [unclassified Spirosoma]|uniref:CCA tRNA nucleotidyltransferase n=1 Tax=unclassified Spirosoma TaxID=2621999 RepID=UPI00096601D3|nr:MULTISPECIES: HD domain-containing protein [unclassified Spirosoma]MBN8825377.1 HD domain-containing protein [Spirosoma sp.]OJW77457.1 MAG: tRNA nucleotidyltransferase [Spirosoma sp. 48-14]
MNFSETLHKHPIFDTIAQQANVLGLRAYVIGGFVRDLVMNRPSKDIDVVCIGSGIALADAVGKALGTHVSVFPNFGTAMLRDIKGDQEWEVEFVGARKESYRSDSRKPIVEDGTLEDDQNRRDFTINAMGISLNADDFGELLDPFNGLRDIKRKTIRTPLNPDVTFSDDPLRMMRAIRFASQLSFDIEPDTFDAIVRMNERVTILSRERVTDELNKIILSPTPSYGFKLLYHAGILDRIFPELVALKGVETIEGKGHKDNFYHTLQVLDNIAHRAQPNATPADRENELWLRWAALLHDIAKPATKRFDPKAGWTFHGHEDMGARWVPGIFRTMKLPLNEHMRFVQKLVRLHLRPIALTKEQITDSALRRLLFDAGDDLEGLMALCRADITSKNYEKVQKHLRNFDKVERKLHDLEERDKVRNFQPVITGELIMETFDLGPSKIVGDIKTVLREAILDGLVPNTFEAAYPFLLEEGRKRGLTPKTIKNE